MSRVYYAIGDIHGEAEKLTVLHSRILRRHDIDYPGRPAQFVHLGDYVDRGPESYDVLRYLMDIETSSDTPPINLKGNHEQMMLEAYEQDGTKAYHFWLNNGGEQTLSSYRASGFDEPSARHLNWLRGLPSYHWDQAAKLIFVHAGIDPAHFPNDGEDRHLWTRSAQFFNTENWGNTLPAGTKVIHGHTPTQSGHPDIDGDFRRINVDTGACYGGELTAVILNGDEPPRFITS